MTRTVLAIVAHSDDEVLGCGGTLARHAVEGDRVLAIFLTDGVGARVAGTLKGGNDSVERETARSRAASILEIKTAAQFDFPDNRMDSVALLDIVQEIEGVAASLRPEIIYTHHSGDLNVDHRICNQAVLTAFRPIPNQTVRAIYGFEVGSSTEWQYGGSDAFRPQRFVDISETLKTKMSALRVYATEMRDFPHSRSYDAIEALAHWRGASVGVHAAEAFSVLREIV